MVVGTWGEVLVEEEGTTGIDSSRINNFSRIPNNNSSSKISSRIKVVFLFHHNIMDLFLE
jgi:hypothetical protein